MIHKRFLIIRPDRIGDVVLSTPLPREIKKKYPESFVAVMVTEYTKAVYLNNPYVDDIIIYPFKDKKPGIKEFLSFIMAIRRMRFEYAFMLLPDERINYILLLSGIKKRVGVGHKFYQFITNTKSVYRRKYIPLRHEADYCLDMLRKVGIEPLSINPEIHLTAKEKRSSLELKNNISKKAALIGINSTSGNSAPNMPASEYRNLVDKLIQDNRCSVVITDYNPPPELSNIPGVFYSCIKSNLRESIIAFSSLDLLISASTGPMHIAAALKIPTLSLFCPLIACSPLLWGPLGNKNKILLPDKNYCSEKCPGDPKKCNFSGTGGINSFKVFNEINIF